MRFVRTAIIAGVASVALAGAALAAHDTPKMMLVALPNGSVQHIQYQGDASPRVVLVTVAAPVSLADAAFGPDSIFAEMDRMSAMMEARAQAMMRQTAMMRSTMPAANGHGVVMTNTQGQPVGVMQYSYVSSTTDAQGCTQTIRYSSDGAANADQPKIYRTSSGSCGTDNAVPKASPVTPTKAPAAKPAPKIIPVIAPKPENTFTPSRT